MLKTGEIYNTELYKKADVIPNNRDVSVEQAVYILQRQGYTVSKATEASLY